MRDSRDFLVRPLETALFSRTWEAMQAGVREGVAPAMSCGVYWLGERDVIRTAQAGQGFEIFDVSSLTKIVVTSTLTALLVDRGWLRFDLPVTAVLPECRARGVTIAHLLSHQAGFVAHRNFYEMLAARFQPRDLFDVSVADRQIAMRELIFQERPEAAPGERVLYTDVGFLLLGFLLEEVLNSCLDQAADEYLFRPMGLGDTFFHRVTKPVESDRNSKVAPTEESSWREGTLQGQVHDDNTWAMGGYGGHAGLFSSARDLMIFSARLWDGFLSREVLRKMWTRTTPHGERTLGWDTPSPKSMLGTRFSRHTVGHWGFTGTSLWMDLERGLAVTLLTNRVHPTRENNKIREFRPTFHDTIREELKVLGV